jgi:hypothetical protein
VSGDLYYVDYNNIDCIINKHPVADLNILGESADWYFNIYAGAGAY